MQSHHYLLIALALIVGYALAHYWPWPGEQVSKLVGSGG
jgi:hypothetical protein